MRAQAGHTSTLTQDAILPVQRLLDVKAAAIYLSVSQWTVRERIVAGQLPAVRIGTRVLLDRVDLDRWIELNKTREAPS
jgi:excisionase family DNA binding protein